MSAALSLVRRIAVSVPLLANAAISVAQPIPPGVTAAQFSDRKVVEQFAGCVVQRHRLAAKTFVLNKLEDWRPSARSGLDAMRYENCVPASASPTDASLVRKLSDDAFKVALAGALVREEFPAFDAALIATAKPTASGMVGNLFPADCKKCNEKQKAELADARAKMANIMAPAIFGECAIRTDPRDAHSLIMAAAGSTEEASSFAALRLAFSDCLLQGGQFTATRSVLRGLLAISYYRLAHAPRIALAGTTK